MFFNSFFNQYPSAFFFGLYICGVIPVFCLDSLRFSELHDEIDIVAADEINKKVDFYEVKRNEKNADLSILRAKADAFFRSTGAFQRFNKSFRSLSMQDM